MKALRIQVERVVRPTRGSSLRKDRMREELFAHLTGLYQQELALRGDEPRAADRAIARFGDARELSRELQATVAWPERWAFINLPVWMQIRRRRDEKPVTFILRTNAWAFVLCTTAYVLLTLAIVILGSGRPPRGDRIGPGSVAMLLFGVCALESVVMLGQGLLGEGLRQCLEKRRAAANRAEKRACTWRIVGYLAANSALSGGAVASLLLLLSVCLPISIITLQQFWWISLATMVCCPPLALLLARSWGATVHRFENWESLDLDEQQTA